ncbi:hypothetical protein [Psychrobacillus sp. FSL K6-2843]|uniref:hypothetical protein n=1 Tax=Psychrobacillus sp. FSL K6-2843 TaxID=2921549 RepID=UPI00315A18DB
MSSNEKLKAGYWSISAQKHLKQFTVDSPGIGQLGNLNTAGKVGRFLGVIRGNSLIGNMKKIEQMANSVGINSRLELEKIILPLIEDASDQKIELIKDATGAITGLAEYVFDNTSVLHISGQVLDNLSPDPVELITIETMDETKKIPYLQDELTELLINQGYSEEKVKYAHSLLNQFRLIQIYDKNRQTSPIISNEYVWGANSEKMAYAISTLEIDGRQTLKEVMEIIQNSQGFPLEKLHSSLNNDALLLAKKVGIINPAIISSNRGIQKEFGFSSNLFNTLNYNDDILDDVKLLLASIRFGENYTPHTTINDPVRFLEKLINSGDIGPHDANYTDYTLLEKKGIVKVVTKTKSSYYGGSRTGACLELVRKDVAEEALKIIKSPDYNSPYNTDLTDFSSVTNTGSFITPEESRLQLGISPEPQREVEEYAVRLLRGELL